MLKLKYGSVGPIEPSMCVEAIMAIGTVLPAKSGRFVCIVAAGTCRAPVTDEAAVSGYCEEVVASSAASQKIQICTSLIGKRFEMPYATGAAAAALSAATALTLISKWVDLYVDGDGVQYADCDGSTQDLFKVVKCHPGATAAESWVEVEVNDAKVNQLAS